MRKITRQEADAWMALARARGFVRDDGEVALGRFQVEEARNGQLRLTFLTPLVAGTYSAALQRKTPPIRFDRTPEGQIIIPGRWWQSMFETLAGLESVPEDERRLSAVVARHVVVENALLPPETDTIEMRVPDEDGAYVTHEALPPGTVLCVNHRMA